MKLEIVRTYVDLKANNHNVKPTNMSIGGFTICLDGVEITYDNFDFYGGWADGYNKKREIRPIIEWTCRGGADVYTVNGIDTKESEYHQFDNFKELPQITAITEIQYEAFTNLDEGVEYEFYPTEFAILVIDRDTNKEYEIHASQEVLNNYKNQMINEGILTETAI